MPTSLLANPINAVSLAQTPSAAGAKARTANAVYGGSGGTGFEGVSANNFRHLAIREGAGAAGGSALYGTGGLVAGRDHAGGIESGVGATDCARGYYL